MSSKEHTCDRADAVRSEQALWSDLECSWHTSSPLHLTFFLLQRSHALVTYFRFAAGVSLVSFVVSALPLGSLTLSINSVDLALLDGNGEDVGGGEGGSDGEV